MLSSRAPEGITSAMTVSYNLSDNVYVFSGFIRCLQIQHSLLNDFSARVLSAAWRTSSSRSTLLLLGSVGVASSEVAVEKLFCPPSAQRAYNHHSVCSCWTKWTEEYLKAYHWHCITQNSFCLCYAHLSRSWSTFGMAGWSFCQGRIGRDCVQPFSMFSLQVSGCFRGAEKQLSNSLERGNCFPVMRWIDIRFAAVLFISPSALSTERRSQVRSVCDWNASPDSWINTIYGPVTADVFNAAQIHSELSIQRRRVVSPRLTHSLMGISYHRASVHLSISCLQTQWREKNTSCRADRVYSFYCQCYL